MKRIVVVLAAVGAVGLLAGCGGESSAASTGNPLLDAGCTSGQPSYAGETWVQERYSCDGDNLDLAVWTWGVSAPTATKPGRNRSGDVRGG